MAKSNGSSAELDKVKQEIKEWPEWMQREARFEGEAKVIQPNRESNDSETAIRSTSTKGGRKDSSA